jgi:GNAT superfamily N-acetyltransferase
VPLPPIEYRKLLLGDIEAAAQLIADGFEGYREFAPAGWEPPPTEQETQTLELWAGEEDFWGEVAFDGEALVGHAAFLPATRHRTRPAPDPELGHLSYLFVAPSYWGSGTSRALLARAMSAAQARGFNAMRLFTPFGQSRARRFYERDGFRAVGEPMDLGLGLPTLEYRRALAGATGPPLRAVRRR